MFRILTACAGLLLCVTTVQSDETPTPKSDAAAKQYKLLIDEYEEEGGAREFAGQFVALAEQYPKSPVAVDALVWVVVKVSRGKELHAAITLLTKGYLKSERIGPVCQKLPFRPGRASETLLRALRAKSSHKDIRDQAGFHLAVYLQVQLRLIKALNSGGATREQFEQYYGKEFTTHLAALNTSASLKEIETIYADVILSDSDIRFDDATLAETARKQLYAIRNLSIGRPAPEITGQDVDGTPFRLSDYRGKVVLLDFWGHW